MKNIKLGKFTLKQDKKNLKHIFDIICKEIPASLFTKINFKYFEKLVKKNIIKVFSINKGKIITSVITVVDYKNYKILKNEIIWFFIKNPIMILFNINHLFKSLFKGSEPSIDKNYLHLLHLVIYKQYYMKKSLKYKDKLFNYFFKQIIKNFNAKILFLCYEKDNMAAKNFYYRNNFKTFAERPNLLFVKKKYR